VGWFNTLFSRGGEEQKSAISPQDLLLDMMAGQQAKSGVKVTWETALQASTALACARVIAEGIAQVPLKLFRALPGGGSEAATDHPLYEVLHSAPASWLTSYDWRETMGMHLALGGRSYAMINSSSNPRSTSYELIPLTPQQVRTERASNFNASYFVTIDGREQEVAANRILHLHGPSWDACEGLDGIKLAREAIGLSLATEEHGARQFKNGAILGGVLSSDAILSPEQMQRLKSSWQEAQAGLSNAYRTAVLWGGMKWTPRAQQNDQAQWVEVRRFQVAEVCRFFRVLPIMVGEADRTATYASSEQMFLAHVVHTMGPWYQRIEQRLNLQLLSPAERAAGYGCKFVVQGLLRGSHKDRAEYYRTMYGIGAMNPNEIRALDDLNPYDGGEQFRVPLNMADPLAETDTPAEKPQDSTP
jgi:HK97 family phage portal protein